MNKMMRRFRNTLRLAATASVVAVLVASTAGAHHDDESFRLRTRDNNIQDYEHVDLTPAGEMACDWGASQLQRSEITVKVGGQRYPLSRQGLQFIFWW